MSRQFTKNSIQVPKFMNPNEPVYEPKFMNHQKIAPVVSDLAVQIYHKDDVRVKFKTPLMNRNFLL